MQKRDGRGGGGRLSGIVEMVLETGATTSSPTAKKGSQQQFFAFFFSEKSALKPRYKCIDVMPGASPIRAIVFTNTSRKPTSLGGSPVSEIP